MTKEVIGARRCFGPVEILIAYGWRRCFCLGSVMPFYFRAKGRVVQFIYWIPGYGTSGWVSVSNGFVLVAKVEKDVAFTASAEHSTRMGYRWQP